MGTTTFVPTTDFPNTTFFPTDYPNTTFFPTDFPNSTFVPTDFPNTTFVPPTTTQSAVVLKCKIRGMAYTGDRLKFKWAKARNARACEKRCKKMSACTNWTYYFAKYADEDLCKQCFLWREVYTSYKDKRVVSGNPSSC